MQNPLMTMEVLGATKHGGYKESLEFSSCPELPIISSEDDVLIEIAHTDVNPVGFAEVARQQRGVPDIPSLPTTSRIRGGSGIVLETGCSRAPCEWKGRRACFLADPTRRGDRTPLTYWSIVDASCCCRHRPGSPLRDAASVPVGGIDGSRIPSQGRLVGPELR